MRLFCSKTVLPTGISPAVIEISSGLISKVMTGEGISKLEVDKKIESGYLAPGLIDLQINGAFGIDFYTASDSDWGAVLKRLPETGVTAIYPTIITAPIANLIDWFNRNVNKVNLNKDQTNVLGFHLEGPFINIARKGAHRAEYVINPSIGLIESLITAAKNSLKIITLAPELPDSEAAIKKLVNHNVVVSIGHSDATADQVKIAGNLGASAITHLFNAQSSVSHQVSGVAGQGLIDERFTLGLIADLYHVNAASINLAFRAAKDRICLVTDAVSALGMAAGNYELGGDLISVQSGQPPKRADGKYAGSTLRLDHAISNCIAIGIDPESAIKSASKVPAEVMGLKDRGEIKTGKIADLVWLDWHESTLEAKQTWIAGVEVYSK